MASIAGERPRRGPGAPVALVVVVAVLSLLPLARLVLEAIAPGGRLSARGARARPSGARDLDGHRCTASSPRSAARCSRPFSAAVGRARGVADRHARPQRARLLLRDAAADRAAGRRRSRGCSSSGRRARSSRCSARAAARHAAIPLYSPEGIILLLGMQYAPLVFLTLRAGLAHAAARADRGGARRRRAAADACCARIVLPLMTPPLVAGIALCFVSCLGNFGIPALLGIPGDYLVLPTLIYQRLAGLGPSVLSDVAVLSLLIGAIAVAGILAAGRACSAGATSASPTHRAPRAPSSCGRCAPAGRDRAVDADRWSCWCCRSSRSLLTSLVPAVGVALEPATATLDNYRFVLFEHAAAQARVLQQLRPVGRRRDRHRGDRRAARLLRGVAPLAAAAHRQLRRRAALCIAGRGAGDRGDPALPEAAAAARRVALQHGLDHPVRLPRALPRARLCARSSSGYHQLDRTLEEAAQIAGARLLRRLRTIILPLVAPAAAAGALLIFLTAFNELTVSALLWSSGSETLGVRAVLVPAGRRLDLRGGARRCSRSLVSVALMLSTLSAGGPPAARACCHGGTDASTRVAKSVRRLRALDDVSLEVARRRIHRDPRRRPAAARPRCCARSPASTSSMPGAS